MKSKEINQIFLEQTESYFVKEGFKYSKKGLGYGKSLMNSSINYGFSYVERRPQYYYEISLYVKINEVEEIFSKIDGSGILGITYVFPLAYFIDKNNYINKNPKFLIEKSSDIQIFSEKFIESYEEYIKTFISEISQPENMLDFLLNEISTGKRYANNINVLMRTLILLKMLKRPDFAQRLDEFKLKISDLDEDLKKNYLEQMNKVETMNF